MKETMTRLSLLLLGLLFTSCASFTLPNKDGEEQTEEYVNPYPEGTYEHFTHRQDYKKTYDIYRDEEAYAAASPSETSIFLNLDTLRGQLYNGKKVVILDYPIAPGTAKHPTPNGKFRIMEKIVDKESNLYGKIYDASGALVKSNADRREDAVPAGGSFDGADMPYWMRLTGSGIGMHKGNVPRRPASHGCIRHTMDGVKQVYAKVQVGTPVEVKGGPKPLPKPKVFKPILPIPPAPEAEEVKQPEAPSTPVVPTTPAAPTVPTAPSTPAVSAPSVPVTAPAE